MRKALLLALVILMGSAFAYHEFKVPKKAYKKVTIEYFSNEETITSPCSTVFIYYDKNDVEIYREVKKGCCNAITEGGIDTADIAQIWRLYGRNSVAIDNGLDSTITNYGDERIW